MPGNIVQPSDVTHLRADDESDEVGMSLWGVVPEMT